MEVYVLGGFEVDLFSPILNFILAEWASVDGHHAIVEVVVIDVVVLFIGDVDAWDYGDYLWNF